MPKENVTVQLTLFNFQSQFNSSFNLLFMNILLITIPPLIMFLFFNGKKRSVEVLDVVRVSRVRSGNRLDDRQSVQTSHSAKAWRI